MLQPMDKITVERELLCRRNSTVGMEFQWCHNNTSQLYTRRPKFKSRFKVWAFSSQYQSFILNFIFQFLWLLFADFVSFQVFKGLQCIVLCAQDGDSYQVDDHSCKSTHQSNGTMFCSWKFQQSGAEQAQKSEFANPLDA